MIIHTPKLCASTTIPCSLVHEDKLKIKESKNSELVTKMGEIKLETGNNKLIPHTIVAKGAMSWTRRLEIKEVRL